MDPHWRRNAWHRAVVPKPECASESSARLVETQMPGSHFSSFWLSGFGEGLRVHVSKKFPTGADTALLILDFESQWTRRKRRSHWRQIKLDSCLAVWPWSGQLCVTLVSSFVTWWQFPPHRTVVRMRWNKVTKMAGPWYSLASKIWALSP